LYCIAACIVLLLVLYCCWYCIAAGIVLLLVLYFCLYCIAACIVLLHVLYCCVYCIAACIVLLHVLYCCMYCIAACIVFLLVLYCCLYCIQIYPCCCGVFWIGIDFRKCSFWDAIICVVWRLSKIWVHILSLYQFYICLEYNVGFMGCNVLIIIGRIPIFSWFRSIDVNSVWLAEPNSR